MKWFPNFLFRKIFNMTRCLIPKFYTKTRQRVFVYFQLWGARDGAVDESARLPPMWPGFKSRRQRHTWVEFVVGSLLCSERFLSGFSGVLFSSKTNISNFQFDQESGRRTTTLWKCYRQIIIYYLFELLT